VHGPLWARGEVRGGRFVHGLSGEQYALPEAIGLLRKARSGPRNGTLVVVAATDPLNLAGIVTAGARIPAVVGTRLLYEDGVPVATLTGGKVTLIGEDARAMPPGGCAPVGRAACQPARSHARTAPPPVHPPRSPADGSAAASAPPGRNARTAAGA